MEPNERERLERTAAVLTQQADDVISALQVDVSEAERADTGSEAFRKVADAYERLAMAQRIVDPSVSERTTVDGRTGNEIMERLWVLRGKFEELDKEDNAD